MSGGYQVDPDALKAAAKGINEAIAELKSLGIDESGEVGRGFANVELTGMELGNAGLRAAFDAFCERWSWGVRMLVQDGSEIALRLGRSPGVRRCRTTRSTTSGTRTGRRSRWRRRPRTRSGRGRPRAGT